MAYRHKVAVTYVPPFHVDYEAFTVFLGRKPDYKRDLKPLSDAGLISFSPDYSEPLFDHLGKSRYDIAGVVKDYKTGKVYVAFWLGKSPNA